MLIENIKMALSALVANKMRSFLMMLGIIIGIGAVIITNALGETVRKMFADVFANIGVTQGLLYVNSEDTKSSDFFTPDDLENYREVFDGKLVYVDGSSGSAVEVKTKLGMRKLSLSGVDVGYDKLQKDMKMKYGRFLTAGDIRNQYNNIVLKDEDALAMFGTENALGRKFRALVNRNFLEFTVVGIYEESISPLQKALMGLGSGNGGTAYIPTSLFSDNQQSMFMIRFYGNPAFSTEELLAFNKEFHEYVARTKGRELSDYALYTAQENFTQVDSVLGTLSLVLGIIAAISLLVGGIGIMNIMLVSVTERTREIGIRKALGATTRDILTQFLIESAVLSGVGGILGVVFAVVVVFIAGAILGTQAVIQPVSILTAVGFSALVGLFFGLYPARKAATKDPIEALRFE